MNQDLRELLLRLYLQNNPQLKHQIFIYTYQGVNDTLHNPFQFVGADLPPGVKKSIILQNLPSGEMFKYRQFLQLSGSMLRQFQN